MTKACCVYFSYNIRRCHQYHRVLC